MSLCCVYILLTSVHARIISYPHSTSTSVYRAQWQWMFPHHLRAILEAHHCFFLCLLKILYCKFNLVMTLFMVSDGLGCSYSHTWIKEGVVTLALSKYNSGLIQCQCCQPELVPVQQHCVTTTAKLGSLIQDHQALLKLTETIGVADAQQSGLFYKETPTSDKHWRKQSEEFNPFMKETLCSLCVFVCACLRACLPVRISV